VFTTPGTSSFSEFLSLAAPELLPGRRPLPPGTNAGIAVGLQSKDMALLTQARDMGARFIIYSSDYSVLLSGYKEGIARLKG